MNPRAMDGNDLGDQRGAGVEEQITELSDQPEIQPPLTGLSECEVWSISHVL